MEKKLDAASESLGLSGASAKLHALFRPQTIAFVGGSNLIPALKFYRDQGFAGQAWIVNPKYDHLEGIPCFDSLGKLPQVPDLAFIGVRKELAIEIIRELREVGCKAVICNSAGFAETGGDGINLQADLVNAIGDMVALGPNAVGLVNYVDPMAAMMDHFGAKKVDRGVAIVSQGGGLLCDAVFSDRGLSITHMVGCGNQAKTTVSECVEYLLNDSRVTAVGLSFEGLPDVAGLRRAAVTALTVGKPVVVLKFGKTDAGAIASMSHTASMVGAGASWEALFDRLGMISVDTESEFFETLKLFDSGQVPKGRKVLVTCASGVMGVMLADCLSQAGFELRQPGKKCKKRLRALLPNIATPANPQDITMAVWNDRQRQTEIFNVLLDEGFDTALMVQNYPREGMWDISEFAAQVEALGTACKGRDIAAMQLAPMIDCFPASARDHTNRLGMAAMQGLEECVAALTHAVEWYERRKALLNSGVRQLMLPGEIAAADSQYCDEAMAKMLISKSGHPVPEHIVASPESAAAAAKSIGYPVVVKALDARILHKTEIGAVKIGLETEAEVKLAIREMRETMSAAAPDIALKRVLVEKMTTDVVCEVMASITRDPAVGPVMMIAGGGVEAELWKDSTLLAFPVNDEEIRRGLERLKVFRLVKGWRSRPRGDEQALVEALKSLVHFVEQQGTRVEELEVNPILVGQKGVVAVDVVLKMEHKIDADA